jgi:hypothetical protein
MTLSVPPHSGHTEMSISKTRFNRSAQVSGAVGRSRSTGDSAGISVAVCFRFLSAEFSEPGTTAFLNGELGAFPDRSLADIPQAPFPQWIIDETEEDLNAFVAVLEGMGVTVKRPETWPHDASFSTIHWESQGYYNYCPRDIMLVIGDQIIEKPNVIRSRAQESFSYRTMMIDYLKSGAKWYSAPKPMLLESLFDVDLDKPTPRNDEPAFDAANVLRLGRDLIYLVSATGNKLGGCGYRRFWEILFESTSWKMLIMAATLTQPSSRFVRV